MAAELATPLNAADLAIAIQTQILCVGPLGSGKSTQFTTLPGKKFMYCFDPNATDVYRGLDIDYLPFLPDITDVDISAKTLKSKDKQTKIDTSSLGKLEPKTYLNWERDFEQRVAQGFFAPYDWLGFDSFTTFQEIVMDRIQFLNGRLGKHPEQADWTAEMNVMRNIFRVANSSCNVFCTAHTEIFKDDFTGRVHGKIMMTGKNRVRIPLMFAHIFATYADVSTKGGATFMVKTIPDREAPVVRTSLKGLAATEDVTIDRTRSPVGQGIGKWFPHTK